MIVHLALFIHGDLCRWRGDTQMHPNMKLPLCHGVPDDCLGAPLDLIKRAPYFERRSCVSALRLVKEALQAGGASCCILNAANEVAVHAFLNGALSFGRIAAVVEDTLSHIGYLAADTLPNVLEADRRARDVARQLCSLT